MGSDLGRLINPETGETIVQMIGPTTAASSGDVLSTSLYALSEVVIRGLMPEKQRGGLGGSFGYACEYDNEVFSLWPDYQGCSCPYDETKDDGFFGPPQIHVEDCRFMAGHPNFRHKKSGLEINWYKWIGRDMTVSDEHLTGARWAEIFQECLDSIPQEAREKALAEHDYENTPEYLEAQRKARERIFSAIMAIHQGCEEKGHDDQGGHCHRCGLVTDMNAWANKTSKE